LLGEKLKCNISAARTLAAFLLFCGDLLGRDREEVKKVKEVEKVKKSKPQKKRSKERPRFVNQVRTWGTLRWVVLGDGRLVSCD
jgi:hypothetical protein